MSDSLEIELLKIEDDMARLFANSNKSNEQIKPKQQSLEEQQEKIKKEILKQIMEENDRKQKEQEYQQQQQKQQEIQQLIQQIQTLQLYLHISKLTFINRELCLQKIEDDQLNLFLKMKSYGTQEINITEIFWNVYKLQVNFNLIIPITFQSLEKMEHLPWIIELWAKNTNNNKDYLIGVARIQLQVINNSVLTHSPLLSIKFIKSNFQPMIIYDQDIPFEDLRNKTLMAAFKMKVAFGSATQITRIINSEPQQPEIEEQSDHHPPSDEEEAPNTVINEPEEPPKSPLDFFQKTPLTESLLSLLNSISQTIRILPREQFILKEEFQEIIKQLCGINWNPQIEIHTRSMCLYLQIDEQSLDWHTFLNSWVSYNMYKNKIKEIYTKIYTNFYDQAMKIFTSLNHFERCLPQSLFNLIDQQELRDALLQFKGGNSPSGPSFSAITINQIIESLEINEQNQVSISQMLDYLRQFELHGEIRILSIPMIQMGRAVENNIKIWVQNNKQKIDEFVNIKEFNRSLQAQDLINLFQELQLQISLLDAVIILYMIGNGQLIEGEMNCAEIAFWKYIEYLQNQIDEQPSTPIKPIQPKEPGTKRPKPIDYQYCKSQIIVDLLNINQLEGNEFQVEIQLDNTQLLLTTPLIKYQKNNQVPINYRGIFTLSDKYNCQNLKDLLKQHLLLSGLIIRIQQEQTYQGVLAIEEILNIDDNEEFFIPIYMKDKTSIIQARISLKQQVIDEIVQEQAELFNLEGKIVPAKPLSMSDIIEKLKPETLHTFKINIKSIRWFQKYIFEHFYIRVSIASEKKILQQAIPQFISDQYDHDFDINIVYQVKCDHILATQISKCHLLIEMELHNKSQIRSLIGYIPLNHVFQRQINGDLPMDDSQSGQFSCTFNIDINYSTDQIQVEEVVQNEELKLTKKVIIRVLDFIILDYDNEYGEIYFMIVNPINQSESYAIHDSQPSIVKTQDCIFLINEFELTTDVVELQVRSVSLGEDRHIGSTLIQLTQLNQEGIWAEENYLGLDTRMSDKVRARVGIKIIYICTPEVSNENYLKIFQYPYIKELSEIENYQQYFRNQLNFSYSEISLVIKLLNNTQNIFSTTIIQIQNQEYDQNLVLNLLKEFQFYDSGKIGYVDKKYIPTIFGYFNIQVDNQKLFIPSISKRKPIDFEAPQNGFDYITYLALLQRIIPNCNQLFNESEEIQKKSPIKEIETPKKCQESIQLHFQIKSGQNLNSLVSRIPNSILVLPQFKLESKVFYGQNNPQYNFAFTFQSNEIQDELEIEIWDKYNAKNDRQQVYTNVLIHKSTIPFQDIINQEFPYLFTHQLNQEQIPAYLNCQIWSDKEEQVISDKKQKETVRRLAEYFNDDDDENDPSSQKDKVDMKTVKDLTNIIEENVDKQDKPNKPKDTSPPPPPKSPSNSSVSKPKEPTPPKKPQFYSSSGSSSQPKGTKGSDSLPQVEEKFPMNNETLKRIEKILRQNNLDVGRVDDISEDSDDYE